MAVNAEGDVISRFFTVPWFAEIPDVQLPKGRIIGNTVDLATEDPKACLCKISWISVAFLPIAVVQTCKYDRISVEDVSSYFCVIVVSVVYTLIFKACHEQTKRDRALKFATTMQPKTNNDFDMHS